MSEVGAQAAMIAAALAAVALLAAVREGIRALPAAQAWLSDALAPLTRAGNEGYEPTDRERRRLWVLASTALALTLIALVGWGSYLVVLGAVPVASDRLLSRRRRRYLGALEQGIAPWARTVADAIAAGQPVRVALVGSTQGQVGAIAAEVARVRADLEGGTSLTVALDGLRGRIDSPGMQAIAGALEVSARSGGDAAWLLRRFAAAHDERLSLVADARSATAQARMTGLVVAALPAAGLLFAELSSPGFTAQMGADPVARVILVASVLLQAIAFAAIRRISTVDG